MTLYCECETPAVDLEHGEGCRRCGRPINWSPAPAGAWPMRVESLPCGCPVDSGCDSFHVLNETGAVDPRLLVVAAVAAVAFLVGLLLYFVWPYLLAAGVFYAAVRHLTRHTRRRRPKSSWSSLGRTGALLFAAWNSRWLKPSDRKVTVPVGADGTYCRCGAHVIGTPCYNPGMAGPSSSSEAVSF